MNILSIIVAAIKAFFGVKADIVQQNAEKTGATMQANKDLGAAYDTLAKAADARADVDVERVRTDPGSAETDSSTAGLEYRD